MILCWRLTRRLLLRGLVTRSASTTSLSLRPYQETCLEKCVNAFSEGLTRIGVSLPTGSGKTTVFISLLNRLHAPTQEATNSLVIVNSVELARQCAAQVSALFPHWSVEIEQGQKYKASGNATVTIATYQTLLQDDRLSKFDPRKLKAIVVDECHHAAATSYRRILSHFHSSIKHPNADFVPTQYIIPIFGFSATFSRHDGLALGSVFEKIVYHRDFLDMIKEQWLCDIRFTSVKANIDLKDVTVNSRTGDFKASSLAHVIDTDTVNNLIVQTYLDRAQDRKSTLVFCVNLAHVQHLTKTFRDYGIDARYLYSNTPIKERNSLVESFRNGHFAVLVNCAILTEGADIPNIDCVILARPTRSRNVFAQMIGRGMRLSPNTGKIDCRIIDFVESTQRVDGVVSIPTLFGLDPSEISMNDESLASLGEKMAPSKLWKDTQHANNDVPEPISVTYVDHEDPFSLFDDASGAADIYTLSSLNWVGCGEGIYVLECFGKGHIRIEPVEGTEEVPNHYKATYTPTMDTITQSALKVPPYLRSRKVLTAETLAAALKGCDTYAVRQVIYGPMGLGLLRSARWRKMPASEQQKKIIAKRWAKRTPVAGMSEEMASSARVKEERLASLTKGEAANIITRLKHGAQARYEKKVKAETKARASIVKEMQRSAREHVRVGPLFA